MNEADKLIDRLNLDWAAEDLCKVLQCDAIILHETYLETFVKGPDGELYPEKSYALPPKDGTQ